MSKGNDLVPLVVDLNELKSNKLNEVFLRIFGEYIKKILGRTFGGPEIPVTVRGKRSDVAALAQLLAQERRYMESYLKYGLDDKRTYQNKWKLDDSVSKFERDTGIKWPLK